jgi:hypothetical protein
MPEVYESLSFVVGTVEYRRDMPAGKDKQNADPLGTQLLRHKVAPVQPRQ